MPFNIGIVELAVLLVFLVGLYVIPWALIFRKAGWGWGLGLAMLVPGVNLLLFLVLAFAPWPVQEK